MIRAILACDDNWGIGYQGNLPWPSNQADLAWFRQSTLGSTVVMGRHTWESLPKRPLPGRDNIVITTAAMIDGATAYTIDEIKTALPTLSRGGDVWIIGGSHLVSELLDFIEEFHLSKISGTYQCDVHLPRDEIFSSFYPDSYTDVSGLHVEIWKKR